MALALLIKLIMKGFHSLTYYVAQVEEWALKPLALSQIWVYHWGPTVGNGLEVIESVDILEDGGPADVIELVISQGNSFLFVCFSSFIISL